MLRSTDFPRLPLIVEKKPRVGPTSKQSRSKKAGYRIAVARSQTKNPQVIRRMMITNLRETSFDGQSLTRSKFGSVRHHPILDHLELDQLRVLISTMGLVKPFPQKM